MNDSIDITHVKCPMTFVKVLMKLDEMETGDILTVYLTDGEPVENVPESLKERNFEILSIEPSKERSTDGRNIFALLVKK